ncbi:MAG: hypothetical protein RI995_868 [Bacteroidota bacterium]
MFSVQPKVEICTYSLSSVQIADRAGAHRVELCTSPWDGGTTPSTGMIKAALATTSIEIHAMLRPRGGDFCYSETEKDEIRYELESLLEVGVHGVVFGALLPNGDPDVRFLQEIKNLVGNRSITCHRAIDVARDTVGMVDVLVDLGFQRILTSGQCNKAIDGIETIAEMVERSNHRIEIMAGSGVNANNCLEFLKIGCDAIHLSARKSAHGLMEFKKQGISMGGLDGISEFEVFYSDVDIIRHIIEQVISHTIHNA